jgi:hypothetical protein
VKHRNYEMSVTAVTGGSVGAFAAHRFASNVVNSTGMAVVADTAGSSVGGKLTRIPAIMGRFMAASAARNHGASETQSALSAHIGGKVATAAPKAEAALGTIADTADNVVARGAAKLGDTALHEAPGAIGAIAGAKLSNGVARLLVYGVGVPLGALAGGTLAAAVLPEITWTND